MESALDDDLERVSSDLQESNWEIQLKTTDGTRSDTVQAKPDITVKQMLQDTYGISRSNISRSTVYFGDSELELDDTFEECGISDGARLEVDLAGNQVSHVVVDNGSWENRMGFASLDEVISCDSLAIDNSA